MPSWKKVILSGSDAALNSLDVTTSLTASGLIYPTADGINNQAIITDGAGNLIFGNPNSDNTVITIKNVSGGPITKGTPLYITGSGTSGNLVGVIPADAGNPALMPAGVIAGEDLPNNGDEGIGLINGFINGVDTSAFASGDQIYVAVGGGYTNIVPTGSALVQKLGNVEKSDNLNGSGVINGPGAARSVPNINPGYTWVGDGDWVATPVSTASLFVTSASYAISSSLATETVLVKSGDASFDYDGYLTFFSSTQTTGQTLFKDTSGGPKYNPVQNKLTLTGSLEVTGGITGSLLGTASFATSASYAATASLALTGNNFVGTGITYLNNINLGLSGSSGASTTSVTSSVIPDGSTDLTLISAGVDSAEAMFIDYVLYDLAKNNKRAGNLRLTWNTTDIVFDETTTTSIGNTNNFTFSVDNNGGSFELLATNTTGQNMYLIYEYKFLYIV